MESIERAALKVLHNKLKNEIETNWIAGQLRHDGVISDEQLAYFEGDDNVVRRAENLLFHLPDNCKLEIFFEALRNVDQVYITEWIENEINRLSKLPARLYQSKPDYHSKAFKRYSVAANDLQVKVFNVDRTMNKLEPMINFLKTMKGNDRLHWDNIFAIVDAGLGKKRTQQSLKSINQSAFLKHMEDVIPDTSFPLQAMMILESRQAESLALNGQTDEALMLAMSSVQNIDYEQPCRHNGKLIYSLINIQVQYYKEHHDQDMKNRALIMIHDGFSQFNFEDYDTQRLWKRMFLVKEAFLHLGIDTGSQDIATEIITQHDLSEARRCLDKVRYEYWEGIDKRRKMLYYRAEAKYALLQGQTDVAKSMLEKALDIAGEEFKKEAYTFRCLLLNITLSYNTMHNISSQPEQLLAFEKFAIEETNRDHENLN